MNGGRMKQFKGVYPISGEDLSALPVKEIGPAVAFYREVLGFAPARADETTAVVERGGARANLQAGPPTGRGRVLLFRRGRPGRGAQGAGRAGPRPGRHPDRRVG